MRKLLAVDRGVDQEAVLQAEAGRGVEPAAILVGADADLGVDRPAIHPVIEGTDLGADPGQPRRLLARGRT